MTTTNTLSAHDLRRVSVESKTDPRTILRVLRGQPVWVKNEVQIRAALRKLKLTLTASAAPEAAQAQDSTASV